MSAADMSRVDPLALNTAIASARAWKLAWGVTTFCTLAVIATLSTVSAQRDSARTRAEVCLAAAKVDHVRVGEFVDKDSYQFCYSDADVDVCVFRKVTP